MYITIVIIYHWHLKGRYRKNLNLLIFVSCLYIRGYEQHERSFAFDFNSERHQVECVKLRKKGKILSKILFFNSYFYSSFCI